MSDNLGNRGGREDLVLDADLDRSPGGFNARVSQAGQGGRRGVG